MNEVKIVTSDSKIWNLQQTTFDILEAVKKGPVHLNLLREGPCCETSGINQLLSQISTLYQLPADYFTIYTSNQLNSSTWPQVRRPFVELAMAQAETAKPSAEPLLEKKFGIFIGRSNAQRLGLARYQGLIENINWIGEQSTATIQSWFKDMQQVLDHNALILQQLTNQKILKTDFIND